MIYTNPSNQGLESQAYKAFGKTLSLVLLELLAFKSSPTAYQLDRSVFESLLQLLKKMSSSSGDELSDYAALYKLLVESPFFKSKLQPSTMSLDQLLAQVSTPIEADAFINGLEEIDKRVKERIWHLTNPESASFLFLSLTN